jgi:hypothetical protein
MEGILLFPNPYPGLNPGATAAEGRHAVSKIKSALTCEK